jgi:pheromone shutdown-related protein TraB
MNNNNVHLEFGEKKIHLIGTAHVSKESINEVTSAIRGDKPGMETPNGKTPNGAQPHDALPRMVCVELDQGRYAAITQHGSWEQLNVSKVLKERKGFLLIANIALASFQRRLGNELGVKPGEEMLAAIHTAKELDIPFSLCDREVQITLRRAWASCGLWSKCKLLAALLSSAFVTEKLSADEIENLKNSNELDGMMQELAGYLPAVKETLIDERDLYLAAKIWEAAGRSDGTTLAVVGAGHLRGIQAHLANFAAGEAVPDLARIESVPPRSFFSKAAKWIIPVCILALITAGFLRADFSVFIQMLWRWVLWNGGFAALGCILALGHPLAILVSFLGAPITTLNPFIGVGILSGLVQATVRKPRVYDAENIASDATSLKGLYRNRISRVLLVFFLSSLGSSIATLPAVISITGLLVK